MPNIGLNKIQLENRIYQVLESQIQADLSKANATQQNTADIKRKLRQQAKAIAEGVIDEIHLNATVELYNQVSIMKGVLEQLLNAVISSPTAPMDGGTSFKIGLMSAAIPGLSTLQSLMLSDRIS